MVTTQCVLEHSRPGIVPKVATKIIFVAVAEVLYADAVDVLIFGGASDVDLAFGNKNYVPRGCGSTLCGLCRSIYILR